MAYDPTKDPLDPAGNDFSKVTEEGALENQPEFRKAALNAWTRGGSGTQHYFEAGFSVDKKGKPGAIETHQGEPSDKVTLKQEVDSDTSALFHTHPNNGVAEPSDTDKSVAKRTGKPVMVASRKGLYEVAPGGQVTRVYNDPSWMDKKPTEVTVKRAKGGFIIHHNGDENHPFVTTSAAKLHDHLDEHLGDKK